MEAAVTRDTVAEVRIRKVGPDEGCLNPKVVGSLLAGHKHLKQVWVSAFEPAVLLHIIRAKVHGQLLAQRCQVQIHTRRGRLLVLPLGSRTSSKRSRWQWRQLCKTSSNPSSPRLCHRCVSGRGSQACFCSQSQKCHCTSETVRMPKTCRTKCHEVGMRQPLQPGAHSD